VQICYDLSVPKIFVVTTTARLVGAHGGHDARKTKEETRLRL